MNYPKHISKFVPVCQTLREPPSLTHYSVNDYTGVCVKYLKDLHIYKLQIEYFDGQL